MTLEGVQKDLDTPCDGRPLDLIDEVNLTPGSSAGLTGADRSDVGDYDDMPELRDESDDEADLKHGCEEDPAEFVEVLFHEADEEDKKQAEQVKWTELLEYARFDA